MRRILLLTLLSAVALIAFAAVPAALFDSGTAGVSASATSNLNLSKSNINRTKDVPKTHPRAQDSDPAGIAVNDHGCVGCDRAVVPAPGIKLDPHPKK